MPDPRKTYAQLGLETTVQDTDLLATWRSSGPLKRITATTVRNYMLTPLAADTGATLVGYKATGTDTVSKTVAQLLGNEIYVSNYSAGIPGSAELQKAIDDAIAQDKTVVLPPSLIADGAVTISSPVAIVGARKKTNVIASAATFNWITIASSDVSIENIQLDNLARVGGWDFTIDTGGASDVRERIQLTNITTFHSKGGLRDTGAGLHVTVDVNNYFNRILKGPHVEFTRSFAYLKFFNSTADFNGSGSSGNFTAFKLTGTGLPVGAGGGIFQGCNVLGTGNSADSNNIGFEFTDYNAAWFVDECTADTLGGRGYRFTRCNKIEGSITAGLCQDHAVTFVDTQNVDLRIRAQGRRGVGTPLANKDLIRLENGGSGNSAINITVGYLSDATGNAVNVVGSQAGPTNLIGGVAYNSQGRAVVVTGTSSFQWTGFVFVNNTTGNYDLANAAQWVEGVFASGGRATFNGPGTA